MFIRSILLFTIILLMTALTVAQNFCNCTSKKSELDKFISHVLKRRTRSIVFPNKAQLLLTPAFTKAVLDGRPRGLSYSVEFDMYSPLPDTIDGWKPTVLLKKINNKKTTKKPIANDNKNITKLSEDDFDYQKEYESSWQDQDYYYKFPFEETEGYDWNYDQLISENDVPTSFNSRAFKRDSFRKFTKMDGFQSYFNKMPYRNKNEQSQSQSDFSGNFDLKKRRSVRRHQKLTGNTKFNTHQPNMLYSQTDRERREIFGQLDTLGKMLNFNMKKCIERAKCELISHFRSYGESVMEDIVRIILSEREYGRKSIDCDQHFLLSCPYRILDFLTKKY